MKRTYAERRKAKGEGRLPGESYVGKWLLLHGPEHHLKREVVAEIKEEAKRSAGTGDEPSWEVLEGPSATAREVLNRSQTGALFGGARLIVVREADRMDGDEQDELAKAVKPLPAGVTVVLVTGETGDRGRPSPGSRRRGIRAALQRAIAKEGLAIEFPALKAPAAAAWAINRAKELGKRLEPAAARKLVEQKVGVGLGELESELEKLVSFVGELGIISGAHVEEVTPRLVEEDIFRLVDAVGRRETGRAVGILRGLLQERREEPGRVLWQLAHAIRMLWQTKILVEAGWRPGGEVDAETAELLPQEPRNNVLVYFARLHWQAERMARQANGMSWARLARAVQALRGCDFAMKGITDKVRENAAALELLVVQLCTDLEMPVWDAREAGGRGER